MPDDSAPDLPPGSTFFRTSAKSVRGTITSFALVLALGAGTAALGILGMSLGLEGARFLHSSGQPFSLVLWGGFFVVVALTGLVVYGRKTRRGGAGLGGLTLSPAGVEFLDDEKNRRSVPWILVDGWTVTGAPAEPVIRVTLIAGEDGRPLEGLDVPVHVLAALPDEVIGAFARYSGKDRTGL